MSIIQRHYNKEGYNNTIMENLSPAELQKLQIEYADAVARGDMATAARARIDIDQLTSNRQSDLAVKAIEAATQGSWRPIVSSLLSSCSTWSQSPLNAASLISI